MDPPDGCPDEIYQIMRDCWAADPDQRPNFVTIEKQLYQVTC